MQNQVHNQGQSLPIPMSANQSQPSMMQSAPLSSLQQNQQSSVQQSTQSMIQPHPQSVLRPQQQQQQSVGIHQQQVPMIQPSMMPPQQQQQLMGQPSNASIMQQNQLIGQQNSVSDIQQQQQQRLLGQQSNLLNIQQQQQMLAQQNLSSMFHQQLGPQSNVSGLQPQQQQQLLGNQSGNSSMQTNQHSAHMLQQSKVPLQQQSQQSAPLLPNQGQQSQSQQPQQQSMSQTQSQPVQLQQQPNQLQQNMQQRLQASIQAAGSLHQLQNVMDQQKQLYQSQRALPETSSTSLDSTAKAGQANGGDWQEEVYQKMKVMKETYLPELYEMYQKIATQLQQHDSLPRQPKSEQLEKLKIFKTMLERIITFLQVSKSNISPNFREMLGSYEKQIINFINTNRPRKPFPSLQPGELPPPHMHSMLQPQSQITQVQPHDSQMDPQMQSMNLQGSVEIMPLNNMTNMQCCSMPSISGISTAPENMLNSLQPSSNLDSGQGNSVNSLNQVSVGSLQQNSVSTPQQTNIYTLSSQSGVDMLPSNINPFQSNSNMLQHQLMKKQQERQMMQALQLKHKTQQLCQMMLKEQLQKQQLHQQAKQQLLGQMQTHQLPQLHQMNDVNVMKMRQGMGVKPEVFQQHLSSGQRSACTHQQLKPRGTFPNSCSQLLQVASTQMPQHSSPLADQQNLLSSFAKSGTPLQSAGSSFVVPSPSTPLAPSPIPGDNDKPVSGISSQANAENIAHQQNSNSQAAALSLAIGTPGISAAPLFAEFTGPDGTHGNALTTVSGTGMQNQGQSLPIPLSANESQPHQQLFSRYIQNNMTSTGLPGSSGLPFLLPSVSGLTEASIAHVVNQNSTIPSMGQGVPSDLFANSQMEMQARLQVLPQLQQQHMYWLQLQQHFLKQKLQLGSLSHLEQQPQQQPNLLQPNQLQFSQQSGVQSSSVMLSKAAFTKPAAPITLPSMMASQKQQQQHLNGQPSKAANLLQNQLIGQQSSVGDIEQQLHQRLLGQQSNLLKLQQQQGNHAVIFCVFVISVILWFLYLV